MCVFCGNDVSQNQYDSDVRNLNENIRNIELKNYELTTELIEKDLEINELNLQLKNLAQEDECEKENFSGIKFLQEVFSQLPFRLEADGVDEFKEEFEVFLNQNITSEVGYLDNFNVHVLEKQISIYITYKPYEYDSKDLIVFKELMMQSLHNKDLMNEMGWIRNYTTGVDLFISRQEVGFYIRYKKECDSYIQYNDSFEYLNTLFLSRHLMD
ncbi:hypothetical protein [Photobacterium aquimaris]|uniref:Uncharacterized protein n=1 Tax=Photobacterium aquimaris TaxID=512643 RepID=A0A2T3HWN7_9GAMM|nr:hypothetical protein [Photobacterium aquimaris]OBU21843.1 hypothetical protein AYY21_16025 [Photobacterium aquimaris]PQJ37164.1 hypothetical protein BTN98_18660 [Photobacterium aquimaris]PSU03470.1 hypothetical protein C0W81_11930 [Photobacterium aquimaris]